MLLNFNTLGFLTVFFPTHNLLNQGLVNYKTNINVIFAVHKIKKCVRSHIKIPIQIVYMSITL